MTASKRDAGNVGEDEAALYLQKKGYTVLARNYRTKVGEIDLIVSKKGLIVFVEVKKRSSSAYGKGYEAVDFRKQERIAKAAGLYLSFNGGDAPARFDVISIDGGEINHIENAFTL